MLSHGHCDFLVLFFGLEDTSNSHAAGCSLVLPSLRCLLVFKRFAVSMQLVFILFLPLCCLLVFKRFAVSPQLALVTPSHPTVLSLICSVLNFTQYYTFHSQLSAFTLKHSYKTITSFFLFIHHK
ncbi:hypothetical protein ILYODFUR_033377 [Ilyodon furcidens]|uniref:Uncharacterized protein n=1 Tax=Ilyodon furcidens TaxID=33524 RepID=A0ABV0UDI7_9TELE